MNRQISKFIILIATSVVLLALCACGTTRHMLPYVELKDYSSTSQDTTEATASPTPGSSEALGEATPTPVPTPVATYTPTPEVTAAPTATAVNSATAAPTATPYTYYNNVTAVPTATPYTYVTAAPTAAPTTTPTAVPTATPTATPTPTPATRSYTAKYATDGSNAGTIWNYLIDQFGNPYAAAGILGNIHAESGCVPYIVEAAGATFSKEYTAQVDSGEISRQSFAYDAPGGVYGYGYGLCQWGWERKAALYDYAQACGTSVGDLTMQCSFLMSELSGYSSLISYLYTTTDAVEACQKFSTEFERAGWYGGRGDFATYFLNLYG